VDIERTFAKHWRRHFVKNIDGEIVVTLVNKEKRGMNAAVNNIKVVSSSRHRHRLSQLLSRQLHMTV
jgi:hypothetical protein